MDPKDEFYVGYANQMGKNTKKVIFGFLGSISILVILGVFLFSFYQKPFPNSTFELNNISQLQGVYHESPYPMLRVEVAENSYKNILLLGFGKSSVNPYLHELMLEHGNLNGKTLSLEGNLIYYNGKTLIQITDMEKVSIVEVATKSISKNKIIGEMKFEGEIIDPKCYFGVMKPGFGKIHRSCAIRCISGGIPPVFLTTDHEGSNQYFLLTDIHGNAIHQEVLPFVGKPALITGIVEKSEDWNIIRINLDAMKINGKLSKIYPTAE